MEHQELTLAQAEKTLGFPITQEVVDSYRKNLDQDIEEYLKDRSDFWLVNIRESINTILFLKDILEADVSLPRENNKIKGMC